MSLISVTPKFDSFVEFCSNQPGEQYIDHSIYDTCAIGDWAESMGEFRHDAGDIWYETALSEVEAISKDMRTHLLLKVGNAGNYPELSTYAGLTEFLVKFQHDLRAAAQ